MLFREQFEKFLANRTAMLEAVRPKWQAVLDNFKLHVARFDCGCEWYHYIQESPLVTLDMKVSGWYEAFSTLGEKKNEKRKSGRTSSKN